MPKSARKKFIAFFVVSLSLFLLGAIVYSRLVPLSGKTRISVGQKCLTSVVRWVIDGDTIVLYTGQKVRYIGLDAPETAHPDKAKAAEYYGREAADFNRKLVFARKIRLEFDQERYDKYGRLLAYVYLQDGTFINAELLKQGYADTLTIPPNTRYARLFKRLQEEAKKNKRGMWGGD